MSPLYLWIATGAIALTAVVLLARSRRYGSIVLAALVCGTLCVVRQAEPGVIGPFVLLYMALLLALPRASALTHGVAAVIVFYLGLRSPAATTDWAARAKELFVTRDYIAANAAFERAREIDPENLDLLEQHAFAAYALGSHEKAMELMTSGASITRRRFLQSFEAMTEDKKKPADEQDPRLVEEVYLAVGEYTRFLRSETDWIAREDSPKVAIAELDRAMQNPLVAAHGTMIFASADLRVRYVSSLMSELTDLLEQNHPDRIDVVPRLAEHLRSAGTDSAARRLLTDPLSSARLREQVGEKLDVAWRMVQEADKVLGDIRGTALNRVLPARLARAELDLRLGRFVRGKEELQCLLATPLAPYERQRALTLIAELLEEVGAPYESALYLKELRIALGDEYAPLSCKADYFEALFAAAEVQPEMRSMFIAEADAHLAHKGPERRAYSELDLRTVGYRGVAALTYENNPTKALSFLRNVYDALRLDKRRDPSILRPKRAKLFVEAMLDASAKSERAEDRSDGIAFANALIEVSTGNAALRIRRATLLEGMGDFASAASDLKVALRNSPLDHALFDRWVTLSETVKDINGRSPREIAELSAISAAAKLKEVRKHIEQQAGYQQARNTRQTALSITKAFAQIFEHENSLASDPLVAWHMSREFGRVGATDEARNFLFKAVSIEPDILPLRLALGELRLDLGLYSEAARDFREILRRDPTNLEVATRAYEALVLDGDLAGARALRVETMNTSPTEAGLEFAVSSAIENGQVDRAIQVLGPHLGTKDPRLSALIGKVRLADSKIPAAMLSIGIARAANPESPELLRDFILATARTENVDDLMKSATEFVNLPRLLPVEEVVALLDELSGFGKDAAVGFIADKIGPRYSGRAAIEIEARAMLANLRAGNAQPLRDLVKNPVRAPALPDSVIQAAFGLTLRELGPLAGALFLQAAREYSDHRDEATLPTAAAFALTPHVIDLTTFLSRYERRFKGSVIPLADQTLWWLVRQRSSQLGAPPTAESGAEGELQWLAAEGGKIRIGDLPLAETYLKFLLFRWAGPGFEGDARALADKLVAADRKALTAARYVAEQLEKKEGVAAASALLLDRYQSIPGDLPTYLALGELLDRSDAEGVVLQQLAHGGKTLFPTSRVPNELSARSAIKRKDWVLVDQELGALLDADPKNTTALRLLAVAADVSAEDERADRAVTRIQASASDDPELRSFLVRRCSREGVDGGYVIKTLGPLLAVQPRFYAGAQLLAGALVDAKKTDALLELASQVVKVIPSDPESAKHGDEILGIAVALDRSGNATRALDMIAAGLIADPGNIPLRKRRVDLTRALGGDAGAIIDLEILCTLAPRDANLLFSYGDILLQRRGDKLDTVLKVMPAMRELAPNDSRLADFLAKLHYLRPRYTKAGGATRTPAEQIHDGLQQVRLDLAEAIQRAQGRPEYWYQAGVISFLLDDLTYAKIAFEKVNEGYRFSPRARYLLELCEKKGPAP